VKRYINQGLKATLVKKYKIQKIFELEYEIKSLQQCSLEHHRNLIQSTPCHNSLGLGKRGALRDCRFADMELIRPQERVTTAPKRHRQTGGTNERLETRPKYRYPRLHVFGETTPSPKNRKGQKKN
jgi:alpha-D-ribose 1-methylphosphonate 5-triphosphate diphosphatase PhnM